MESGKEEKATRRSRPPWASASGGKQASTICPRSRSNRMRQKARAHRASAAGSGAVASASAASPRSETDGIRFIPAAAVGDATIWVFGRRPCGDWKRTAELGLLDSGGDAAVGGGADRRRRPRRKEWRGGGTGRGQIGRGVLAVISVWVGSVWRAVGGLAFLSGADVRSSVLLLPSLPLQEVLGYIIT